MIDLTLKQANILIVDDQEANIDVLEGLLAMQGYTNYKSTADSRVVASLYREFEPDLILLDLSMPYLSGFEVMAQLKTLVPADTYLPILVLTADVTNEAKQRALSGGAVDFLTKPFDLIEVGLRIRNLLLTAYLQQQLKNHNHILEEKVKERTLELENKNAELIIAKDKAETSDRLKSAFINNISHEIRTPLNGILGFGQILTDPDLEDHEKEMYLEMLNSSSARLINTVTNFLDISLLTSGNQKVYKKEVHPAMLINEVIEKYQDYCMSKNIYLSFQIPNTEIDCVINTDGDILSKILYQLVDNAVKFTKEGGISIGFTKYNNNLHFFIKDSGIGISEENRQNIFDDFAQEDSAISRKYEGSGLGLSIAKKFTELLGGRIWMESEKGIGSTFYFSIPRTENIAHGNTKNIIRNEKTKQTILIAEDDDINFAYFKALLTHDLIEIIHAANGIEAVEKCRNYPEIELVLMDLKMRDMDGFEATTRIKSFRNDLPVIAITAYSEIEDKEMAMQAGCDEFITKPVKKDFLLKKLEEYGLIAFE